MFERAGTSTGGSAHSPTRIHCLVILNISCRFFLSMRRRYPKARWRTAVRQVGVSGETTTLSGTLVFDPAASTSLISFVSDLAPVCRSLHHHVARRCTCGQRAFRASVCAFSLDTSSWVSVPSSTCTPHTRIWHGGATCRGPSTAAGTSACRLQLRRLSRRVCFSS